MRMAFLGTIGVDCLFGGNSGFPHILEQELLVITLALGSRSKQGLANVRAKSETRESHFMFLGM
jgi:hypothetical protein